MVDGFFKKLKGIYYTIFSTDDPHEFIQRCRDNNIKNLEYLRVRVDQIVNGGEILEISAKGLGKYVRNFIYEGNEAGDLLDYPEISEKTKEARKNISKLEELNPSKIELRANPPLEKEQKETLQKKLELKLEEGLGSR